MSVDQPSNNRVYSIGEVSKRSGIAVSAIHFYEAKGLITSHRNASNQRQFQPGVLRYLAIVKVAQRVGIPLDEIKNVLGPYEDGTKMTAEKWRASASRWEVSLNNRIDMLTRLRDELNSCIGCGCLSLTDCPLRNPADVLASEGAGARILERPLGES